MYRAGLESILGLRRHGKTFEIDPCIPTSWPSCSIAWRFGTTRYALEITNPDRCCRGISQALLDGTAVDSSEIPLVDDGAHHVLHVVLGEARAQEEIPAQQACVPAPILSTRLV
jgi:cyclic beta-1,2-glucan synthetase